jgi:hypothetical protein
MTICLGMILLLGTASTAMGQWQHLGLSDKQVISLERGLFSGEYIYAGTHYEGLYMTSDGGDTWHNRISSNVPICFIGYEPHFEPDLFTLVSDSWSAGLYRSSDDGQIWYMINTFTKPRRMGFDSQYPGHIYISFDGGIITSIEYGYDYIISNTGLPDTNIVDVIGHISDHHVGYALGYAFVARTTNFGQLWEDVGGLFGIEEYNPVRITCDPNQPNTLYVTTWAYLARSFDAGVEWEYFATPTANNVPIVCDPITAGTFYIGTNGWGVFKSSDFGETFEDITGDLGNLSVNCLDIDVDGRLLAGTNNGIYVNDVSSGIDGDDAQAPERFSLHQNYPNPFNASTRISFAIPEAAHVSIVIYDLLGKEIRTLFDGRTDAGETSVLFDASDLSSGVYFYRLKAGEFADTKRLTLIK